MPDTLPGALAEIGWSDRVLALYNGVMHPGAEPARIVGVERSACVAAFADGARRLLRAAVLPAVGDWVAAGGGMVREILPRWSVLARAEASGPRTQVLAANVDLVIITAPADRLSLARVERELAVAWDSGAQPLLVVTKADLGGRGAVAALEQRLAG
ncbi:MAG: GTPase RsgA, partial [Acidimicrobiales bacterium]